MRAHLLKVAWAFPCGCIRVDINIYAQGSWQPYGELIAGEAKQHDNPRYNLTQNRARCYAF